MARYRKIDPRVWNDEKFRSFPDDAKLAFLFVLTHPAMTSLGAMRATVAGLAAEMRWTPKRFGDAIGHAISHGMIDGDEDASFLGVKNFLKYNEPEGPNSVAKAWLEALDLIPECAAKTRLIARCRKYLDARSKAFRDAIPDAIWDAMPDAMSDASPIQEQEQEQEQDKDVCSEPRANGHATTVINFPVSGRGSKEWALTEPKVAEYRASFPRLDVLAEFKKARQWCVDNPAKRKTPKGMPRFLTSWLMRAQNGGRGSSPPATQNNPSSEEVIQQMMARRRESNGQEVSA